MKTIPIHTTDESFPYLWAVIWKGTLGLTEQESNLFAELIRCYELHKEGGLVEPYLSQELLNTEMRKIYQKNLGISAHNLRNLIASLRSKGVIKGEGASKYFLDPRLQPVKQLLFNFTNLHESK